MTRAGWVGATAALLAAAGALSFGLGRRGTRREAGLDVVLVTIDTFRRDALGASGGAASATPFIDRLAREGVVFERAYAHNVVTLPSHANILTGRYPLVHGVRDNAGFRFPKGMDTLATLLKARGYRTGAFISAFPLASRFGLDTGFDVYDDRFLGGDDGLRLRQEERPGPRTAEAAREWLVRAAGKPSFLWVHLYEPHFPYRPPEPFASRFAGDPYAGEVAAADAALEPLLAGLVERAKDGRTLVVLTGDHGESRGEHGERTHGIFAYDATLGIPLVLFCPRLLGPARVTETVRHVDIVPTVLDALGLPAPNDLSGRSLLPAAAGQTRPPAPSYFEALSGTMNRRWAPLHGVVRDRLKYIDLPLPEMYDLALDPKEERNLAASRPREMDEMRGLLARLRAEDRGVERRAEDRETRERLRALGYLASAPLPPSERRYGPDDDPKRLIALDAEMQTVDGRFESGDLSGALALCQDIVRRRAGMPLVLVQLSRLQREAGDIRAAVRSAEEALALGPDDPQTAATLASHLNDAGRFKEAADLLEPYARRADPSLDVLMTRGAALASRGRSAEALAAFERVREIAPRNAMALVNIGTVHLGARDYTRAREAFEAALAQSPGLPRAHNALGVLAAETGRPAEAIARWQETVGLDPRDYDALFNLGLMLRKEGRTAEARRVLDRFAREAPPALYAADIRRARGWLAAGS
jgi:arylsulfatase A-like enzyme/tetratricopeptide (TPR) repeat protein